MRWALALVALIMTRVKLPQPAQAASDVSGHDDVEELHLKHDDEDLPAYYPAHGAQKAEKDDDAESSYTMTPSTEKTPLDEKNDHWASTDDDDASYSKESWEDDSASGTERSAAGDSSSNGGAAEPAAEGLEGLEGLLAREFAAIRDEIQRDLGGAHGEAAADFAGIRDEMGRDFEAIKRDLASAVEEVRADWGKVTNLLRSIW